MIFKNILLTSFAFMAHVHAGNLFVKTDDGFTLAGFNDIEVTNNSNILKISADQYKKITELFPESKFTGGDMKKIKKNTFDPTDIKNTKTEIQDLNLSNISRLITELPKSNLVWNKVDEFLTSKDRLAIVMAYKSLNKKYLLLFKNVSFPSYHVLAEENVAPFRNSRFKTREETHSEGEVVLFQRLPEREITKLDAKVSWSGNQLKSATLCKETKREHVAWSGGYWQTQDENVWETDLMPKLVVQFLILGANPDKLNKTEYAQILKNYLTGN